MPSIYGYEIREPYDSELSYFKSNRNVSGMATEDGKIILNPYSGLSEMERHSVLVNEATRLFLRDNPEYGDIFEVLPHQREQFKGTPYYDKKNERDLKHTLIGRIISGDPSANTANRQQIAIANKIKELLNHRVNEQP